jgi:hypothetical protein
MTDNGSVPRRRFATGNYINNVVLGSSFMQKRPGNVRFAHANPGSAVRNIDEIRALLQGTNIDVLCISDSWFKKHYSVKNVSITGYKLLVSCSMLACTLEASCGQGPWQNHQMSPQLTNFSWK